MSVVVVSVLAMALGGAAAPSQDHYQVARGLELLWTETFGADVPDHIAAAFARLGTMMDPADVSALRAGATADSSRALGDMWTVCLSRTIGCDVKDASGTKHETCEQFPLLNHLWVYRTVPAVLEVEATGDAVGTWAAYTIEQRGRFAHGALTGTSCVVFDEPDIAVVRTNGMAEYEN